MFGLHLLALLVVTLTCSAQDLHEVPECAQGFRCPRKARSNRFNQWTPSQPWTDTQTTTGAPNFAEQTSPVVPSYSSLPWPQQPPQNSEVIRGVNIGGWLVLEPWMTPDLFPDPNITDQWSFDSTNGAASKLKQHWNTYFTETDVQKIASWGINALRIPIGFWAYDNSGTPYIAGADAYLERAIEWARAAGLQVLVDCHGSPGSQNGFDNSGHSGNVKWQTGDNMQKSISILTTIAKKYGSDEYADVVMGIELANEPISWGQNNFDTTKQWAQKAYQAVRKVASNQDLLIVMHDSFQGPQKWLDVSSAINGNATSASPRFVVDTHLYQNQVASDSKLTQEEHILKACNWTQTNLLPDSDQLPVFVGEWSAQTNICANEDGSTTLGSTCSSEGCQCQVNVPIKQWKKPLIDVTRKFVETQMDVFEQSSQGWFIWSYKGPGPWGLANLIDHGLIGSPITEREFSSQCGS